MTRCDTELQEAADELQQLKLSRLDAECSLLFYSSFLPALHFHHVDKFIYLWCTWLSHFIVCQAQLRELAGTTTAEKEQIYSEVSESVKKTTAFGWCDQPLITKLFCQVFTLGEQLSLFHHRLQRLTMAVQVNLEAETVRVKCNQ